MAPKRAAPARAAAPTRAMSSFMALSWVARCESNQERRQENRQCTVDIISASSSASRAPTPLTHIIHHFTYVADIGGGKGIGGSREGDGAGSGKLHLDGVIGNGGNRMCACCCRCCIVIGVSFELRLRWKRLSLFGSQGGR